MVTAAPTTADAFVARLLATDDADERHALIEHTDLDPAGVHDAVMRLDAEATRLSGADPRRMEHVCKDMLALAEQADDEYLKAVALRRYGDAHQRLARLAEARECYDKAAAIFTALGQPVDAARTRIGWAVVAGQLGDLAGAVKTARTARRILLAHGEALRVAALEYSLGYVYAEQGRHPTAFRHFTSALATYRSVGEAGERGIAQCHAVRGFVLGRLGRHRQALAELERARAMYQRFGQAAGEARVGRSIAETLMALGRYAAALRAFETARTTVTRLGMDGERAVLALDLADCYLHLNRPEDALAVLEGDMAVLDSGQIRHHTLGLALRRVIALQRLGHQGAAMAILQDAEGLPFDSLYYRAWLAIHRSALLAKAGLLSEALDAAHRAVKLGRASGMRRAIADALIVQGGILLDLGDRDGAERAASRARRFAAAADAAPLLHRAHELLGRIAEARRKPALARHRYAQAIHHLEREQQGVIFEFRDSFAVGRTTAHEHLAALQMQAGHPEQALSTAERAKSRALADAITGIVELRPHRGVPAGIRRLSRELAAAREDYAAVACVAQDPDSPIDERSVSAAKLPAFEARIAGLVQRLQIDQTAAAIADVYGATAMAIPPPSADTVLIEFFFSGNDILRFVIDRDGVRGETLPGAVLETDRLLRVFRLNLEAVEHAHTASSPVEQLTRQARLVLRRLHDRLFGGLDLADRYRSLVVIPHGFLHYLPFHALFDGERYLVERLAVSYAPSATLYGLCRDRPPARRRNALVLACSGNGALPFVTAEAAAVGAVLDAPVHTEAAATRTLLERDGRKAGILHIAAHGRFRADAPLFSAIELADGPLTTADVFNLDLRAALVTLSACETGRALVGGGDELVGLTRAFLYAGAAGLLVSQWRVDDAATATLMTRFYQALLGGAGRAEALRTAQRAVIDGEMPQAGHVHPFFWAGFQIVGNDAPIAASPRRAVRGEKQ